MKSPRRIKRAKVKEWIKDESLANKLNYNKTKKAVAMKETSDKLLKEIEELSDSACLTENEESRERVVGSV